MLPGQLQQEQFATYPPEARQLVAAHLALLRELPLVLVASLLREIIVYDWKFPAERQEIDGQLKYLGAFAPQDLRLAVAGFAQLKLSAEMEKIDWVKEPAFFSERLTGYLWSTHQVDAFRSAAIEYMDKFRQAAPAESPRSSRLGMAVIGQGVEQSDFPLFRKLRPHGVHFTNVDPAGGLQTLLEEAGARAAAHPVPYGHWYIDGSAAIGEVPQLTGVSWNALQPVRAALLEKMQAVIHSGSGGPELLQTTLARLSPEQLGMKRDGGAGVLDHFQVSLLTEGSGTQIFSTTFVQWSAREALRRAQPLTVLAHFTPRQRQRPMNELLDGREEAVELDPHGSLVDADMGAFYMWIDQARLPNPKPLSFLVWFEGHREAVAIGPNLPGGTDSNSPATLKQILQWIS